MHENLNLETGRIGPTLRATSFAAFCGHAYGVCTTRIRYSQLKTLRFKKKDQVQGRAELKAVSCWLHHHCGAGRGGAGLWCALSLGCTYRVSVPVAGTYYAR